MDHILRQLPPGARVLDLAAQHGSFPAGRYPVRTVRADLEFSTGPGRCVRCDARRLPFQAGVFEAVICSHGLEHFAEPARSLSEMGRVLATGGALFLAVPDARTVTDRVYRFLARGGGHVNAFRAPSDVENLVIENAGLPIQGRRTLYSSLSFLHPANRGRQRNRRFLVLLGAGERALRWTTWLFRWLDRIFGTRFAIYGWAFYCGRVPDRTPETPWTNTCIRCGASQPAASLQTAGHPARYRCPACGTRNLFTPDQPFADAV